MKFTQTHAVGRDETAPYDLSEYPTKLTDFIDEVLKHTQEWGTIVVRGHGRVEYKYGKLLGEIPDEWKDLTIRDAKAAGGWSLMDFYLFVQPQINEFMRPKQYCPKFQPWCGTGKGEVDEACVDYEKRTIKKCDACIDKQNDYDKRI